MRLLILLRTVICVFVIVYGEVAFALSHLMGKWFNHSYASKEVNDVAKWAAKELTTSNGEDLVHISRIDNIQTKIVYGIIYRLSIEMLIEDTNEQNFKTKTCRLEVFEQPWQKVRHFATTPFCKRELFWYSLTDSNIFDFPFIPSLM